MSTSRLRCMLCGHIERVSEADPDTSVSEIVEHAASAHGFDPRLGNVGSVITLESGDSEPGDSR